LRRRRADVPDRERQNLVARPAEQLARGGVDVDVPPPGVDDHDRLERALEDGAEQALAVVALRDVDEEPLLVERLAVVVTHRVHEVEHPPDRAVGADDPVLELDDLVACGRCLCPLDAREVVRMDEPVAERLVVEKCLRRVPGELLDLRAAERRAAGRPDRVHVRDERKLLDQAAVLLLGDPPLALGPPLLGDVDDRTPQLPLAVELDRERREEHGALAVGGGDRELVLVHRCARLQHARVDVGDTRRDLRREVGERRTDVLGRRAAVDAGERLVDADVPPLAVGDREAERRVPEEGVGLRPLARELALELLLVRDLREIAVRVRAAVGLACNDRDVAHPHLAAVAVRDAVLDRHRRVRPPKLGERTEEPRSVVVVDAVAPEGRLGERLLRRVAEERLQLRADVDRVVRRLEPQRVRDERQMLDERAAAPFHRTRRCHRPGYADSPAAASVPIRGSRSSNVVPSPGSLATPTEPPCASPIALTIDRPTRAPGTPSVPEARKKRSKRCSTSSGGTPTPVSATRMTTASGSATTRTSTRPPCGVNLSAFERRFSTASVTRCPSTTASTSESHRDERTM